MNRVQLRVILNTIEDYAIRPSAAFLHAVRACSEDEANHDVLDALAVTYENELDLDEYRHGDAGRKRVSEAERAVVRRHIQIAGLAPDSLRARQP